MRQALESNRTQSTETAIETTEALATSMKATAELSSRMKTLEESLNSQRSRELDIMQSSNRTMLIVAGAFASFGFLALFMMGYFQWRTVSRLAEIAAILPPAGLALPGQRPRAALTAGQSVITAPSPDQPVNSDLLRRLRSSKNGFVSWKTAPQLRRQTVIRRQPSRRAPQRAFKRRSKRFRLIPTAQGSTNLRQPPRQKIARIQPRLTESWSCWVKASHCWIWRKRKRRSRALRKR